VIVSKRHFNSVMLVMNNIRALECYSALYFIYTPVS